MSDEDIVTVTEVETICSCCGRPIKYYCRQSEGKIQKHHWMEED